MQAKLQPETAVVVNHHRSSSAEKLSAVLGDRPGRLHVLIRCHSVSSVGLTAGFWVNAIRPAGKSPAWRVSSCHFQLVHQRYERTELWKRSFGAKKRTGRLPPNSLGEDDLVQFGAYRQFES